MGGASGHVWGSPIHQGWRHLANDANALHAGGDSGPAGGSPPPAGPDFWGWTPKRPHQPGPQSLLQFLAHLFLQFLECLFIPFLNCLSSNLEMHFFKHAFSLNEKHWKTMKNLQGKTTQLWCHLHSVRYGVRSGTDEKAAGYLCCLVKLGGAGHGFAFLLGFWWFLYIFVFFCFFSFVLVGFDTPLVLCGFLASLVIMSAL